MLRFPGKLSPLRPHKKYTRTKEEKERISKERNFAYLKKEKI
jgi:hypothetical protein